MTFPKLLSLALCLAMASSACSQKDEDTNDNPANSNFAFAEDNGSLKLPEGFKAVVVADNLGQARHLAVKDNGDVYVKLGSGSSALVALRDTDGDGVADEHKSLDVSRGTGVSLHNGYLYYSSNNEVFRRKFNGDELLPSGTEEKILSVPAQSQHGAKPITFDDQGNLYMTIGAPSNACQSPDRQPGVPGQDPCPLLDDHGGIWKFSATQVGQQQADASRYATGIRHAVGITWNTENNTLYAMQHGRDQLSQFWPSLYTDEDNAELPAEEMFEVQQGDDFGWPYCYYDQKQNQKLLNPEYGGDGSQVGRCSGKEDPIIAFPGHWAPNDIKFYHASQFPGSYKNGAFVAFHGSWNRAPLPQQGYKVVFVPFSGNKPAGGFEEFATQFAGDGSTIDSPGDAEYRPCGLAVGPDGSLYICDSVKGRVWRIAYTGS